MYVSASLDHMININDQEYQFEAVIGIYFSWEDPSASLQVQSDTEAARLTGTCQRPCSGMYQWYPGDLCCSSMFLPHFEFVNARGFDQNRVVRSGIQVNNITGAVGWWSHTQGTYYNAMQFKAFPFDTQYLTVQVQYANRSPRSPVRLFPSATSQGIYGPASGDLISGWQVNAVSLYTYNASRGPPFTNETLATPSNPNDPWPVKPVKDSKMKMPFINSLWVGDGFFVVIQVTRISLFYIVNSIIPIILIGWLSLFVFAISPKHLDTRLGLLVTLVLALTAIQYVLAAVLPASTTVVPTQQIIIISYFVLAFIGFLSVLTYQLTVLDDRRRKKERIQQARRQFKDHWLTFKKSFTSNVAATQSKNRWLRHRKTNAESSEGVSNGKTLQRRPTYESQTSDRFGGMGIFITGESKKALQDNSAVRDPMSTLPTIPDEEDGHPSPFLDDVENEDETAKRLSKPNYVKVKYIKFKQMWREANTNPDYALYMAERIDLFLFIFVLLGYNIGVIVCLVVQSYDDPTLMLH